MNQDLARLVPGIYAIFAPNGYTVHVTDVNGQIGVTLTRGAWSESRQFPYPTVNRDLSIPLQSWKNELITQFGVQQ